MQQLLRLVILVACVPTTIVAFLVLCFIAAVPFQSWVVWPRVAASLCILGVNSVVIARLFRPSSGTDMLLFLGSACLVALGTAGAAHGYFMATATEDLEAWAILICLILAVQGISTLAYMYGGRNATFA